MREQSHAHSCASQWVLGPALKGAAFRPKELYFEVPG